MARVVDPPDVGVPRARPVNRGVCSVMEEKSMDHSTASVSTNHVAVVIESQRRGGGGSWETDVGICAILQCESELAVAADVAAQNRSRIVDAGAERGGCVWHRELRCSAIDKCECIEVAVGAHQVAGVVDSCVVGEIRMAVVLRILGEGAVGVGEDRVAAVVAADGAAVVDSERPGGATARVDNALEAEVGSR